MHGWSCWTTDYFCHFRRSLEAKAALYEQLSRGEGLKELSQEEEEREGGGDAPVYMVDFTKKVYEVGVQVCMERGDSTNKVY